MEDHYLNLCFAANCLDYDIDNNDIAKHVCHFQKNIICKPKNLSSKLFLLFNEEPHINAKNQSEATHICQQLTNYIFNDIPSYKELDKLQSHSFCKEYIVHHNKNYSIFSCHIEWNYLLKKSGFICCKKRQSNLYINIHMYFILDIADKFTVVKIKI